MAKKKEAYKLFKIVKEFCPKTINHQTVQSPSKTIQKTKKYNTGFLDRDMGFKGSTMVKTVNTERFSRYQHSDGNVDVMYHYRHSNNELFSCTANSLDECRERRNTWLKDNGWELPGKIHTMYD